MMESGYYPPGAENDPRAPWNQDDEEGYDYSNDYCDECGKSNEACTGDHEPQHDQYCAVNTTGKRCDCEGED